MTGDRTFIVWADPGLVTGLAWYDLETNIFNSWQYYHEDMRPQLDRLAVLADGRMTIGYEKFISTSGGARTSSPDDPLKAIAVIEEFTEENLIPLLAAQPSSARKLGQVPYLRRLGWYRPGKPHANDAAQHLLAYCLRQRPIPDPIRERLFPGYTSRGTLAP